MNNDETKISFIRDLNNRRVPQFTGLYLAASWGLIQFINWAVDRYLLSPYLIDLSFVILLSMVPSILILSYFHGNPGKDQWNRIERVVVPANFIISSIVIFISDSDSEFCLLSSSSLDNISFSSDLVSITSGSGLLFNFWTSACGQNAFFSF